MTMPNPSTDIATLLPGILPDGDFRFGEPLAKRTWLGVGGPARVLFTPRNEQQLAKFLQGLPTTTPIFVLGGGTNLLIRDGGIDGVVIKLGGGFADITVTGDEITAAGACLSRKVADRAQAVGLGGLEFLGGIPGTVGGAVAMNAGAWGQETADALVRITALNRGGEPIRRTITAADFSYRKNHLPEGWIFTAATWRGRPMAKTAIAAKRALLEEKRKASQPLARTAGSTFVNPIDAPDTSPDTPAKAWQLIASVGGKGMRQGKAAMSEQHCNFMLNLGGATAADFEALAEKIRRLVKAEHGVDLRWEIRRVGQKQ